MKKEPPTRCLSGVWLVLRPRLWHDRSISPIRDGQGDERPLELDDMKPSWRKGAHETASSCSAWLWHRRPVAGGGAAGPTRMVTARVWFVCDHYQCRHGSPRLDLPWRWAGYPHLTRSCRYTTASHCSSQGYPLDECLEGIEGNWRRCPSRGNRGHAPQWRTWSGLYSRGAFSGHACGD